MLIGFRRYERACQEIRPVYVSLTWNGENRFGGGCGSDKGLTDYGKRVLDFLRESALLTVVMHQSNLPDELVARGGSIGLNILRTFIGESKDHFFQHIEHALAHKWQDALCFGFDFFSLFSIPEKDLLGKKVDTFVSEYYFPGCECPACVEGIVEEVTIRFGGDIAKKIVHQNAWNKLLRRSLTNFY